MKSAIFSVNKHSLRSYIDSFIAYKDAFLGRSNAMLFTPNSLIAQTGRRKVYVTDMERDVIFAGTVKSMIKSKGDIKVSLIDVQVYEYSSSSPLFELPNISFSRPEAALCIEELNDFFINSKA